MSSRAPSSAVRRARLLGLGFLYAAAWFLMNGAVWPHQIFHLACEPGVCGGTSDARDAVRAQGQDAGRHYTLQNSAGTVPHTARAGRPKRCGRCRRGYGTRTNGAIRELFL